MDVDIYMSSYQEQMLRLALERHFETEKENFCNRQYKIKTLALFSLTISALIGRMKKVKPPHIFWKLSSVCLKKN